MPRPDDLDEPLYDDDPDGPEPDDDSPITVDDDDDSPIFGDGPVRLQRFRVRVYGPTDDPQVGHVEHFLARREVSASMVMSYLRAGRQGDEAAALQAAGILISSACLDTDGISIDYEPPVVLADDPRLDEDSDEYDPDVQAGQIDVDDDEYDPDFATYSAWSSRKRLLHSLDDPAVFIKRKAITDLAGWLVQEGARRPTGTSRSSRRGRQNTGRGSAGRRS